jgi:hypothetical protein
MLTQIEIFKRFKYGAWNVRKTFADGTGMKEEKDDYNFSLSAAIVWLISRGYVVKHSGL